MEKHQAVKGVIAQKLFPMHFGKQLRRKAAMQEVSFIKNTQSPVLKQILLSS